MKSSSILHRYKKKTTLLLLYLGICSLLQAQSKWQLGGYVAPEYSHRVLHTPNDNMFWTKFHKDALNDIEHPKLSFSTGVILSKRMGKQWHITMRLEYMDKGRNIKGYLFDYYYDDVARLNNIMLLEEPISFQYHFGSAVLGTRRDLFSINSRSVSTYIQGSISVNVLILNNSYAAMALIDRNNNKRHYYISGLPYRKLLPGIETAVGGNKRITESADMFIELAYKQTVYDHHGYKIYGLDPEPDVGTKFKYADLPFSFGIKIGILFNTGPVKQNSDVN